MYSALAPDCLFRWFIVPRGTNLLTGLFVAPRNPVAVLSLVFAFPDKTPAAQLVHQLAAALHPHPAEHCKSLAHAGGGKGSEDNGGLPHGIFLKRNVRLAQRIPEEMHLADGADRRWRPDR